MDHDSDSDTRAEAKISKAILAVLDRHGVPERQRLAALEAAAGMSYQQVRRRMSGETPWNVDEVKKLAAHFGEPLFKLLGSLVDDAGEPATLLIGGISLPCSIWPGERVPLKPIGPLVAIPNDARDHWTVVPIADAGERIAYEIKRLIHEAAPPRRIAILDDDRDLAASIVQFLRTKGFDATAFDSIETIVTALQTSRFDGFVLDWVVAGSNIRDLLPTVRAANPVGPVIILTGQIESGGAQEVELASTIATYRAQLYEKPTRMLSLVNALELGLKGVSQVRGPSN